MEVMSPGTKNVQTYLVNRMIVHIYREFHAKERPGILPYIRTDELSGQFPGLTDAFMRKRLKHCADLKVSSNVRKCESGVLFLSSHVQNWFYQCCDITKFHDHLFQKGSNGALLWVKKGDFRIPSEEELRRMVSSENVSLLACFFFWYYIFVKDHLV